MKKLLVLSSCLLLSTLNLLSNKIEKNYQDGRNNVHEKITITGNVVKSEKTIRNENGTILEETVTEEKILLKNHLLHAADNINYFHGPIVEIIKTRTDIKNFLIGQKEWNGFILKLDTSIFNNSLNIYCRRPEVIFGATFVTITPDHLDVMNLTTDEQKNEIVEYLLTIKNKSLYERQMEATNQAVFTGSYATNPITQEQMPIYVSDYAIECFDTRHAQTRLGVPAHNSKDFEFANRYNLPIKIVVTAIHDENDHGSTVAVPLVDNDGNLKEAYLGEYPECILEDSDFLNNMTLKNGADLVMQRLEENNHGVRHQEILKYSHNDQLYSIKDLAKVETAVFKNSSSSKEADNQKIKFKITLNYAQADFLEIVEKFIINAKNIKHIMIPLIEESCTLRYNLDCYLLRWSKNDKTIEDPKDIFRRDITTIKEIRTFCKDLMDFLEDFINGCPNALENIKKQQKK